MLLWILALLLAPCVSGCGGGSAAPRLPQPDPEGPLERPDLRLNTDAPGAELSLVPDVCCDGQRVYVVWYDRRAGNLDIYCNSADYRSEP